MKPELENKVCVGEEVKDGHEASDPLFKVELLEGAPKEKMLEVDGDTDAAKGISDVLTPLSGVSDSGTFVTESVAATAAEARLVELSGFEFNGAPNFKLGGSLITDNEEPLVNWGTLSTFVTPVLNVGETAFDSLGEANFSPKLNIGELLDLLAALSEVKVDRVAISAGCAVILGEGMVEKANTGPFPAATASSLFSLMSD